MVSTYISIFTSFPHGKLIVSLCFILPGNYFIFPLSFFHFSPAPVSKKYLIHRGRYFMTISFPHGYHIIFPLGCFIPPWHLLHKIIHSPTVDISPGPHSLTTIISSFPWLFHSLWHLLRKIIHSPMVSISSGPHSLTAIISSFLWVVSEFLVASASYNNSIAYGRYFITTSLPHGSHIIFLLGCFIPPWHLHHKIIHSPTVDISSQLHALLVTYQFILVFEINDH